MKVEIKVFHDEGLEQVFRFDAAEIRLTNGIREVKPGEALLDSGESEKD